MSSGKAADSRVFDDNVDLLLEKHPQGLTRTVTVIEPAVVNLKAFDTRFMITCKKKEEKPKTRGARRGAEPGGGGEGGRGIHVLGLLILDLQQKPSVHVWYKVAIIVHRTVECILNEYGVTDLMMLS